MEEDDEHNVTWIFNILTLVYNLKHLILCIFICTYPWYVTKNETTIYGCDVVKHKHINPISTLLCHHNPVAVLDMDETFSFIFWVYVFLVSITIVFSCFLVSIDHSRIITNRLLFICTHVSTLCSVCEITFIAYIPDELRSTDIDIYTGARLVLIIYYITATVFLIFKHIVIPYFPFK